MSPVAYHFSCEHLVLLPQCLESSINLLVPRHNGETLDMFSSESAKGSLDYGYNLKGMSAFSDPFTMGHIEKEKASKLRKSDRNQMEH